MDKWISASEALPEESGWYLVWAPRYHGGSSTGREHFDGGYMFAKYRKGYKIPWSIDVRNYSSKSEVEYWMPLPAKPI